MPLLFLLFAVVPITEIYLLVKTGQVIGAWNTLMLLVVMALLGATLARAQGAKTLLILQEKLARGEAPTREMFDGLMIFLGGMLFIAPGFLSDFIGVLLVLPLTRKYLIGPVAKVLIWRRMAKGQIIYRTIYRKQQHAGQQARPNAGGPIEVIDITAESASRDDKDRLPS